MTQRNIDIMDVIVEKVIRGASISDALKDVYKKRNISLQFSDEDLNVDVDKLGMSNRTTFALKRGKMFTLADVVGYCEKQKITTVNLLGVNAGVETFETMLNYLWGKMDEQKKVEFLIDVVKRNEANIREELM